MVVLTQFVRRLRGGSQPHLMKASDGNLYVVKFQGNPQGTSILANEIVAAKIAGLLGLPVPATMVVELPYELCEGLYFETSRGREPIRPGLHLGSRLAVSSLEGRSYDCLPQCARHLLRNPEDLIGVQLFDLWTCNRDTRQVVFWKFSRDKKFTAAFIDNGHCFGGPNWKFFPLAHANRYTAPATSATWLRWADRIATFPIRHFESAEVDLIPPEWLAGKTQFRVIYEELRMRQAIIAEEITCRLDTWHARRSVGRLASTSRAASSGVPVR